MDMPRFSFEFFPPRTPAVAQRLRGAATALAERVPDFYSVTYGADGSNRDGTGNTAAELRRRTGVAIAPHISCVATPPSELHRLLEGYLQAGIERLVAVRGDRPEGGELAGALPHAVDLVRFIRSHYGNQFRLYVAAYPEGHPEAADMRADLEALAQKVAAGADVAITQYFYNFDAYRYFLDACEGVGIEIPIIPGVMPIHDIGQVQRFSARCGADMPRWLTRRILSYADDASRRGFAADFVADLCQRLLHNGAPSLHFYTLNRAEPSLAVLDRLAVDYPRRALVDRRVAP